MTKHHTGFLHRMVTVQPKFFLFTALLLFLVFGIAFSIETAQVRRANALMEEVAQEVVAIKARREELERKLAFTATDEYVAQEARRRFGYMEEGEMRFLVDGVGSISSAQTLPAQGSDALSPAIKDMPGPEDELAERPAILEPTIMGDEPSLVTP